MPGIHETEYQQYMPQFSDSDAAKFFGKHGEIVSINCRVGPNGTFVIAFATRVRVFGPMALSRVSAEALYRQLGKFVGNPSTDPSPP